MHVTSGGMPRAQPSPYNIRRTKSLSEHVVLCSGCRVLVCPRASFCTPPRLTAGHISRSRLILMLRMTSPMYHVTYPVEFQRPDALWLAPFATLARTLSCAEMLPAPAPLPRRILDSLHPIPTPFRCPVPRTGSGTAWTQPDSLATFKYNRQPSSNPKVFCCRDRSPVNIIQTYMWRYRNTSRLDARTQHAYTHLRHNLTAVQRANAGRQWPGASLLREYILSL